MNASMARARALTAATTALLVASLATPNASASTAISYRHTSDASLQKAAGRFSPVVGSRGSVDLRSVAGRGGKTRHGATLPPLFRTSPSDSMPPRSTPLVGAPPTVQATITTNPPAAQPGVQGLSFASGPATAVDPPDPFVGVGPDHVVQVVNTSMRITDRSGGNAISADLGDLFGISGSTLLNSDPRIIYDSLHGRWILTELEWDCDSGGGASFGHGYVDVLISHSSDPTGDWSNVYWTFNDFLPDYMAPGTSTDKIAFASNVFQMHNGGACTSGLTFAGGDVIVTDWSAMLNLDAALPPDDEWTTGSTGYTPRVAVQEPATSPLLYIVDQLEDSGSFDVEYITLAGHVGTGGGTTLGTDVDLTTGSVIAGWGDVFPPKQPSGNVTTAIDTRPTDAIWKNNLLTFVSTQACTPTGDPAARDCVRVSQLQTAAATPTLAQDFLIASVGQDNYMGGIGMSGNGGLFVAWTRSSATAGDYPSAYAGYQLPTDPTNSISPAELLAQGQTNHAGGRWGDYVGVAQDPQDPNAVWQGNEYVPADGVWATYVNQLKTGSGSTYVPIAPVRLLDTRTGNGLSGAFAANTPRTFTIAGRGGVPSNAVAVTGNLTVTGQTAAGYVALTVVPATTPSTSTLNFPLKDNRANNVTIPLSATGTLSAVYKAASAKSTQLIFDVTGYFLDDESGATYSTVTPSRILDSRTGAGGYTTPFVANQQRSFPVWGQAGVPSTATAVTGNLTVTSQTAAGYLALSNVNTSTPSTSTLNFPVGDNRANGVSVALTGTGTLYAVYKATSGATANVIFDVTGYYVPGTDGLRYFPLNPGRILDGRINLGLSGTFSANTAQTLDVDGHLAVPVGAAAITGNLTVTGQTKLGYAAMTPNPTNSPSTSTINFPVGDNRANGVTVPLSSGGSPGNTSLVFKAISPATTYLILDVTGYFKAVS